MTDVCGLYSNAALCSNLVESLDCFSCFTVFTCHPLSPARNCSRKNSLGSNSSAISFVVLLFLSQIAAHGLVHCVNVTAGGLANQSSRACDVRESSPTVFAVRILLKCMSKSSARFIGSSQAVHNTFLNTAC